ncbi:reprolysin-like metallopeptidase [Capnocytophaga cynodegmi]|uniref:reprolysin-like metallopeptidase n=1 Tax=Capnocytophaga cynodegmi TaxID=28189 RepID=UPI003859A74C
MKYYIYLIFSFISFGQVAFAQKTIKTSTKSIDVIRLFSAGNKIEWAVPISENEKILLQWEERNTSFTEKEGIRTFVGYNNDEFVATLSISKDQKILGNFEWKQTQWDIKTSDDGYIILFSEEKGEKCGLCSDGNCHVHHPKTPQQTPFSRPATEKNTYHIHSDEILRVYRLAVLVDWYYYSSEGSIEAVKKYWSSLEATLNEIYMRDIGIKFEIVNDEKLIFNTSDKQAFDYKTSRYIIDNSTLKINQLIGADNYDVGIVIAKSRSKNNGLAVLGGAFDASKKAAAVAIKSYATIGHELGHMFGSLHTFTTGGDSTIKTEPENGTSIMSYGSPRDFFSLPSIYFIRRRILGDGAYYQDRARTILKKEWLKGENPVFGIDTKNQAPIIDVSKLESEYRLPKETFFQFTINATDPDNDPLLYAIHQADIKNDETSSVAEFVTEKSSSVNTKAYYTHWVTENGFLRKQYDLKVGKEYTFWLGVNDTKNTLNERSNHATRYDMHEAKVKFVEGKPFKITKFEGKKYKMGEKVTLAWDVDPTLFQNTKVRILLSDDFGKTFKHTLVPETDNDGNCEIVMPNIAIGRKVYYTDQNGRPIFHSGLGLIKVEVLDHIAFALTDNDITTGEGGFEIEKSVITLNNLPEKYVVVNQESEIPLKANVTATSTCGSNPVTIVNKEEKNGNITTRIWTATDNCNNQTSFVQYIEVKPLPESVQPLQFVGTLPKDFVTYCHNAYTENEAPQLQVIGGKSPKVYLTENKQLFGDQKGFQIKRVWVAVDEVAKTISHTQYIVVRDIEKPELSAYPQDMVVKSRSEVPQRAELTATDCGNKIEVKSSTDDRINNQGKEVIIYSWLATDSYGNEEYYEQTITIDPDATPPSPIDLKFITTPPASISATCNAVLSADYSQFATDGCPSVNITHTDTKINGSCANTYTIKRLYTATGCDQSVSFEQIISVTDDKAPTFNESLPIDISVEENKVPTQVDLTATDNCSENIQVTKSQENKEENGNKVIIYKWETSDECGNKVTHTQKITIQKSSQPTPPKGGVQPPTGTEPTQEMIVYNGVSTESGSENYLKFEPIENYKNLQIEIFNELGQKVYESKNYQKNGEVFRGYANVKGVFRKGKRLPTGTYFYVLKYQDITGKSNTKQGYLFVR